MFSWLRGHVSRYNSLKVDAGYDNKCLACLKIYERINYVEPLRSDWKPCTEYRPDRRPANQATSGIPEKIWCHKVEEKYKKRLNWDDPSRYVI
jgi:hypothetical protein